MNDLLARDFASYQACVQTAIAELGGHPFARASVVLHAAGMLRDEVRERLGLHHHLELPPFTEWVLATASDFARAADKLDRLTGLHAGAPAMLASSETAYGGRLVLRPLRLTFETVTRTLVFAYAAPESFRARGNQQPHMVWLTNEGTAYLTHAALQRPKAASTHTRSEEGALKSLRRMAEEVFRVQLVDEPVTVGA